MHYLIDGHNLIGALPHIDLADPEDEAKLVMLLRKWTAGGRKRRITVIFDGGLPGGQDKSLSTGPVRVVFASYGQTADSLLIGHIQRAKNPSAFTLVSGDRHVIGAAEAAHLPHLTSVEFARRLAPSTATEERLDAQDQVKYQPRLEQDELDMWLKAFGADDE